MREQTERSFFPSASQTPASRGLGADSRHKSPDAQTCVCKKQESDRRAVSAPDLLKTEGLSFTVLTRNASSRPQAARQTDRGSAPLTRGLCTVSPGAGGAGVSTAAGLPPPEDITVTRGTEATGSRVRCPGCLVQGTAAHPRSQKGHTWKTKRPRLMERGTPTVLNAKMAGSCKTWTGDKVTLFILGKFQAFKNTEQLSQMY